MPAPDIKALKEEYDTLTKQLADPELISDWQRFQDISKRRAKLEKIVKKAEELDAIQNQIEENKSLLGSEEEGISDIAQQELETLQLQQKGNIF